MNDKNIWLNYDSNSKIRILPYNSYNSYGLEPTLGTYYTRKPISNETILEKIPIVEIERFLRRKKLEKIKNIE